MSERRAVTLDRDFGALDAPDRLSRFHGRLIGFTTRALAPIGHLGISRIHSAIHRIMCSTETTIVVEKGVRFEFPSADYYWARLLDRTFNYEPEIDSLLRLIRKNNWIFVDLGANFGYWTVRVAGGFYGNHRVIAVEPADHAFKILRNNVDAYPSNVSLHKAAIDEESGTDVALYGTRHAGISINRDWNGGLQPLVGMAKTTTIDTLLLQESIDPGTTAVLIKFDIEGAEMRALRGAVRALAGKTAILLEDQELGGVSEATKHCFALGMNVYTLGMAGHIKVSSQHEIEAHRGVIHRMQAKPLPLLATASLMWIDALTRAARARS